jgi:serine/threonine-protein kinase
MTSDALLGRTLGGVYRIDKRLGAGGIGAVYVASQTRTGRRYAVKVLLPEVALLPGAVERFRREAAALGALGHAGIVQLHDFDTADDGTQFLVMELLEGEDLSTRLAKGGALPWPTAVRILEETASALSAAHALGLVHRDLKPANIFLARRQGAAERATLLDFGLARNVRADADARLTATGAGLGTPLYMSPEQARGEDVDLRCDVYALGCVLYEMLTGAPPFDGPTLTAVLARILTEPPPQPTLRAPWPIPSGVDEVVRTALAKHPAQRYPSAQALVDALHRAGAGFAGAEPAAGAAVTALAATVLAVTPSPAHGEISGLDATLASSPPEGSAGASQPPVASASSDARGPLAPRPGWFESPQPQSPSAPTGGPNYGAPAASRGSGLPPRPARRGLALVAAGALVGVGAAWGITAWMRLPPSNPPPLAAAPETVRVAPAQRAPSAQEPTATPAAPHVGVAPLPLDVAPGIDAPARAEESADAPIARPGPSPTMPSPPLARAPDTPPPAAPPGPTDLPDVPPPAPGPAAPTSVTPPSAPGTPGAAQLELAARQLEATVRQREVEIAQLRAALPLAQSLREDARTLSRLARPPSCDDARRRVFQAAGRGDNATVAGFGRRADDLLERVCGFYDAWDAPGTEGHDKLQRFVTALDHAERMAREESATNQPRADAERVLAAIADVRRVVARVSPNGARFPCRDAVWGSLRDLRSLDNHWAAAAAGQVSTAYGRFCASTRMDAPGVELHTRQLEDAASSSEQSLRAAIAVHEELVDRLRAQAAGYRGGASR